MSYWLLFSTIKFHIRNWWIWARKGEREWEYFYGCPTLIMYNFIIFYRLFFGIFVSPPKEQFQLPFHYNHPLHAQYFLFYFHLSHSRVFVTHRNSLVNLVFNICIKDLCAMDVPFTHGGIYWFARSLSTYFMVIAELLTGASDDVWLLNCYTAAIILSLTLTRSLALRIIVE